MSRPDFLERCARLAAMGRSSAAVSLVAAVFTEPDAMPKRRHVARLEALEREERPPILTTLDGDDIAE